jgi:hypothetical protein
MNPFEKLEGHASSSRAAALLVLSIAVTSVLVTLGTVSAETGVGNDIFKVVLTIIGADKARTGDIVAIVTVNDHARVKFFELKDKVPSSTGSNVSESGGSSDNKLIEYVATFPNVTVNSGDKYSTCVLPLKSLKIVCTEGQNSPAKRPEFVDMSLESSSEVSNKDASSNSVNQSALISPGTDGINIDSEKDHKKKKTEKVEGPTTSPAFNTD